MALVFRCDGCGELETTDKRNSSAKHKGSLNYTPKDVLSEARGERAIGGRQYNRDDMAQSKYLDLCGLCVDSLAKWIQGLVKKTED